MLFASDLMPLSIACHIEAAIARDDYIVRLGLVLGDRQLAAQLWRDSCGTDYPEGARENAMSAARQGWDGTGGIGGAHLFLKNAEIERIIRALNRPRPVHV
jgi:hypothetical protein